MALDIMSLPKILKIEHSIEPLWNKDAGRNSNNGTYTGTFCGYFDKLTLNIGKTTQNELTTIRNAIESPIIQVKFKDTKTGLDKTEQFYGTAIKTTQTNVNGLYDPFNFSLVAVYRR